MIKSEKVRVAIFGASGKLGRVTAKCALSDPRFVLTEVLTHSASPHLDQDLGLLIGNGKIDLPLREAPERESDVWIDASLPLGLPLRLKKAMETKTPLVIATTGLTEGDQSLLKEASLSIPILSAPNFSIGMALLRKLAQETARRFPFSDINLIETHHSQKKDRPSGSALLLAQALKETQKSPVEIPIQSLRVSEVIGEHSLVFSTPEERLTLSHHALSRTAFAKGALEAALFVCKQPAGLYTIDDLLFS